MWRYIRFQSNMVADRVVRESKITVFLPFLKRQLGSVFRLVTELCFDLAVLVQNCPLILSWAIEAYVMNNVIASLEGGL